MFGELIHGMFNEVVGDDPALRRDAALPYTLSAVFAGGVGSLGAPETDRRQEAPGPVGP